jgi:carbamate kinase
MLPKVEAIIAFLEAGGRQAIITDSEHVAAALEGRGGTRITP